MMMKLSYMIVLSLFVEFDKIDATKSSFCRFLSKLTKTLLYGSTWQKVGAVFVTFVVFLSIFVTNFPSVVPCITSCPYNVINISLRECPPPNEKFPQPSLFRALTSKGSNRTLTCNPLGIHSIRELTRLVNERLPIHLQLTYATGHSGRVTLSSIAMNNNVGSVEVGAATKHKDP